MIVMYRLIGGPLDGEIWHATHDRQTLSIRSSSKSKSGSWVRCIYRRCSGSKFEFRGYEEEWNAQSRRNVQ